MMFYKEGEALILVLHEYPLIVKASPSWIKRWSNAAKIRSNGVV